MKKNVLFISFVVSLGGFLFGFDAGIISGVMSYVGPEFNLNDIQTGWVVSSPSFAAMIAMLVAGRLSDLIGRKKNGGCNFGCRANNSNKKHTKNI